MVFALMTLLTHIFIIDNLKMIPNLCSSASRQGIFSRHEFLIRVGGGLRRLVSGQEDSTGTGSVGGHVGEHDPVKMEVCFWQAESLISSIMHSTPLSSKENHNFLL
jgi:hypothetical protein